MKPPDFQAWAVSSFLWTMMGAQLHKAEGRCGGNAQRGAFKRAQLVSLWSDHTLLDAQNHLYFLDMLFQELCEGQGFFAWGPGSPHPCQGGLMAHTKKTPLIFLSDT